MQKTKKEWYEAIAIVEPGTKEERAIYCYLPGSHIKRYKTLEKAEKAIEHQQKIYEEKCEKITINGKSQYVSYAQQHNVKYVIEHYVAEVEEVERIETKADKRIQELVNNKNAKLELPIF